MSTHAPLIPLGPFDGGSQTSEWSSVPIRLADLAPRWAGASGAEQQVGEAQQAAEQTDADRFGAGPDADAAGHAMTQPQRVVRGVKINRQLEVRRGRLGGEWINADFPAGRVR